MSDIIKIDASSEIDTLMTTCAAAHDAYMEAARSRSAMAAAIIKAKATRQVLNAAMQTKEIVADLLAMADPEVGMVEVIGNDIAPVAKVRVMALAMWHGFVPGEQEFAIFKSATGASLYLKERGLMKVLMRLGAKHLQIQAEMPVQHKIEDGPTIWRVPGQATCEFSGEIYTLQFQGAGSIQLPCKMYRNDAGRETGTSDNIDAIMTKARRRMLQALYRTIAAEAGVQAEDDVYDETSGTGVLVRGQQPRVIEAQSAAVATQRPPEPDWANEVAVLQGELPPEQAQLLGDAHADLAQAKSSKQLRTVWEAVNMRLKEIKMDSRGVALLTQIKNARKGEVA
jgi:hypothetical protein